MNARKPIVFFNASVILAAINSPKGGSAKIINWCKKGLIVGVVSEIVIDEVTRNLFKVRGSVEQKNVLLKSFKKICPAPGLALVNKYNKIVADRGDSHIFASCKEVEATYLVSLDKKHILALRNKMGKLQILNPRDLIETLSTSSLH